MPKFEKGNIPWDKGISKKEFLSHFKHGHPMKGEHHTVKTKALMKKNHWSKHGGHAWSKGLTKKTDVRLASLAKNVSKTRLKLHANGTLKSWCKGLTKETNKSLQSTSTHMIGRFGYGKGQTKYTNKIILHHAKVMQEKMKNKAYAKETFSRLHLSARPTSLEHQFQSMFLKNKINISYVGNNSFYVNGKCPDFINKKRKVIVEVRHTKVCEKLNDETFSSYKRRRIAFFNRQGFKCLVFSEKSLSNPEKVINSVKIALHTSLYKHKNND